jgi:hypothetical protein
MVCNRTLLPSKWELNMGFLDMIFKANALRHPYESIFTLRYHHTCCCSKFWSSIVREYKLTSWVTWMLHLFGNSSKHSFWSLYLIDLYRSIRGSLIWMGFLGSVGRKIFRLFDFFTSWKKRSPNSHLSTFLSLDCRQTQLSHSC